MFSECTSRLGHDVVDGNVCSNVGFIQGKLSNIFFLERWTSLIKCTDGWIKLVLRSKTEILLNFP
jgi:hypothetical protein